jgi:hypothetical protein
MIEASTKHPSDVIASLALPFGSGSSSSPVPLWVRVGFSDSSGLKVQTSEI